MAATRRTPAMANILAMPSTLRYILLRETLLLRPTFSSHRYASTTSAPDPDPNPETPPVLSFRPGPSNDPLPRALPTPLPSPQTLQTVNDLFSSHGQQLLWTAPRFYDIPFNLLVPEVCILGRSNVGKSTLLNALGGANAAIARRIHGQEARRAGLAITSATAGCTKLMNAYGFGPPLYGPILLPSMDSTSLGRVASRFGADGIPDEDEIQKLLDRYAGGVSPTSGRKDRRLGSKNKKKSNLLLSPNMSLSPKERRRLIWEQHLWNLYRPPVPRSLIVLDTPGYGLNSQRSWGIELAKYLEKRTMLKGAVVLIDSVAGIKQGDVMALELLRDHNVRTSIVLTKADKVRHVPGRLDEVCLSVWETLRKVESGKGARRGPGGELRWREGRGWEREVWVTGAGDLKSAGVNGEGGVLGSSAHVVGARMAICKMAQLVEDDRREDSILISEAAKPSAGKIITFEEIERMMSEQASRAKGGQHGGVVDGARGRRRVRPVASF